MSKVLAPNVCSREDILDHMPPFLDNAIAELRERARSERGGGEQIAVKHGVQRFELGFDIDSLVRDYGILRKCIFDLIDEAQEHVPITEYRVLTDFLLEGISVAVKAYIEQRDAAQRLEAQKHFAFLAHELRNQISTVSVAFSVLQKRAVLPEIKSTHLLDRGLGRLREMVDGALIEASLDGGGEVQREHLGLAALLRDACEDSEVDAEARGIKVHIEAPESLTIEADPRLLRSAVTNLFRNAVKFCHAGGKVTMRGGLRAQGGVFIEVEDTCGGLAPGVMAKLFTPFAQAGADRSGFGLGLSITRQAVEMQGGGVTIRNLPGEGCVFAIDFPKR